MRHIFSETSIFWVFVLCIQSYIDGTVLMGLVLLYLLYCVYKDRFQIRVPRELKLGIFGALVLCGSIIGFFYFEKYNIRDYIRDVYYFVQPIVYIYAGYMYFTKTEYKHDFYKTVVFAGFIVSCLYIIQIIQNPSVLLSSTVVDIRNSIGKESFIILFSLFALLTRKDGFNRLLHNLILIITAATFVLQFSRTSYGTLAIVALAYMALQGRITVKLLRNIAGICLGIGVIWVLLPNTLTSDFVMRIQKSLLEVSTNTSFSTLQDVQSNWRGYEIHLVSSELNNANLFTQLFGFGFGKTTALDYTVNLGGQDFTQIATFHNGYIFVLLKNGIIGLIAYISFYLSMIIKYRKVDLYEARMLVSYSLGMLFLTYTKGGILRGSSVIEVCLYFGFCIGSIIRYTELRNHTYE